MVTINKDDLNKGLQWLGLSVSKDTTATMSRRVLRLVCDGLNLYGYTYDGENNIRIKFCSSTDNFEVFIDYFNFSNFIRCCEGDISLNVTKKALEVKSTNVKCNMPLYDPKVNSMGIPDPTSGNLNYNKTFNANFKLNTLKTVLDPTHTVDVYRKICFNDKIVAFNDNDAIFINSRVFDKNFLLSTKSVDIICAIGSGNYTYKTVTENSSNDETVKKNHFLCIEHENLNARLLIDTSEYPYGELIDYIGNISGANVNLKGSNLIKAINASSLFKMTPMLIFNSKGIFLTIDSVGFEYKISNDSCNDVKILLTEDIAKKLCAISDDMYIYYDNSYEYEGKTYNTLRCSSKDIEELISASAG